MFVRKLKYASHVVSGNGVECDPDMVEPVNVNELQWFMGFAYFYCKFIKEFGSIAQPLTKEECLPEWKWGEEQQEAFDKLHKVLLSLATLTSTGPSSLECMLVPVALVQCFVSALSG